MPNEKFCHLESGKNLATNDTKHLFIRVIRGCFKKAINFQAPGCATGA
jgi:hypothetical protein